jgi:hypothetical protein
MAFFGCTDVSLPLFAWFGYHMQLLGIRRHRH